ncbi:myosin IC heavy chain-like [Indicator indicator]|uniref:myosin IC heavy chain-like n=1 Tax=Indicator indicator TaxID=1002788 RepID=UPI0023DFB3F4|nr:myosin IC heavy chain-like [Indicator indicator]
MTEWATPTGCTRAPQANPNPEQPAAGAGTPAPLHPAVSHKARDTPSLPTPRSPRGASRSARPGGGKGPWRGGRSLPALGGSEARQPPPPPARRLLPPPPPFLAARPGYAACATAASILGSLLPHTHPRRGRGKVTGQAGRSRGRRVRYSLRTPAPSPSGESGPAAPRREAGGDGEPLYKGNGKRRVSPAPPLPPSCPPFFAASVGAPPTFSHTIGPGGVP